MNSPAITTPTLSLKMTSFTLRNDHNLLLTLIQNMQILQVIVFYLKWQKQKTQFVRHKAAWDRGNCLSHS